MTLEPITGPFAETREALHQLAFFALGPARYKAVGRMGLRATPGGFGTPEFEGRVARVEGDTLVYEQDGNVATQQMTTIRAAAEFLVKSTRSTGSTGSTTLSNRPTPTHPSWSTTPRPELSGVGSSLPSTS